LLGLDPLVAQKKGINGSLEPLRTMMKVNVSYRYILHIPQHRKG